MPGIKKPASILMALIFTITNIQAHSSIKNKKILENNSIEKIRLLFRDSYDDSSDDVNNDNYDDEDEDAPAEDDG